MRKCNLPVAQAIETNEAPGGHPEFRRVLNEMLAMHCRKGADYGTDADVFANVRTATEFGLPAYLGAVLRANDKMARLKAFATKGTLANESVEDAMLDLANYAVIALVLYRESKP